MSDTTVTKRRKPLGKDISTRRRVSKARRHFRVRRKVTGSAERPRLSITKSSRHIVAQLVDDSTGKTIASASTLEADVRALDGDKKARAAKVGQLVADRAKNAGVSKIVFDRGGNDYHGRIAALADAAREAGLEF